MSTKQIKIVKHHFKVKKTIQDMKEQYAPKLEKNQKKKM